MSAVMLAVTVAGALAAGVLLAYGVCQAIFRVFRVHAKSITAAKAATGIKTPQVVQS